MAELCINDDCSAGAPAGSLAGVLARQERYCGSDHCEGMVPSQLPASRRRYFFKVWMISRAAFAPEPPVSPVPGCVPFPHKNKFSIGVR